MRLPVLALLLLLAVPLLAQTTAGSPFTSPSFATTFDATTAQITITFANPLSCAFSYLSLRLQFLRQLTVNNFVINDASGTAVPTGEYRSSPLP